MPRVVRAVRPEKILVIESRHLGDVVFAMPALRSLKTAYPAAHVAALVRPASAAVLNNHPSVDEILPYEDDRYVDLVDSLAARSFDLACVMDRDERAAQLAYQAGVAVRIGYDRPANLPFLTHPVSRTDQGSSEIRWSLKLAYAAGGAPVDETPEIFPANDWLVRLRRWSLDPGGFVLIHPGSEPSAPYKRWPVERFAEVARKLADDGHTIVVTGLPAEKYLEKYFLKIPSIRSLVGETSLEELIALVSGARLVITNDTGPSHVAAALKRPCITVTGFADPKIYHPYPDPHRVLFRPIACSPCFGRRWDPQDCPFHSCLKAIGVEDVLKQAVELLDARPLTA